MGSRGGGARAAAPAARPRRPARAAWAPVTGRRSGRPRIANPSPGAPLYRRSRGTRRRLSVLGDAHDGSTSYAPMPRSNRPTSPQNPPAGQCLSHCRKPHNRYWPPTALPPARRPRGPRTQRAQRPSDSRQRTQPPPGPGRQTTPPAGALRLREAQPAREPVICGGGGSLVFPPTAVPGTAEQTRARARRSFVQWGAPPSRPGPGPLPGGWDDGRREDQAGGTVLCALRFGSYSEQ